MDHRSRLNNHYRAKFGPQDTCAQVEAAVKAKGMDEFAAHDHAAGGRKRLGCRCGPP